MPFSPDATNDDEFAPHRHGTGHTSGLAAGTRVATSIGWRPVESIVPGDRVLTFDDGLQTVTRVERRILWHDPAALPVPLRPLLVPAGALGNQERMLLLPEQPVMLESDTAEEVLGDPFTLMPAAALEGFRGLARVKPSEVVTVVSLCFERDQVVFANIGALFYCPKVLEGELTTDLGHTGGAYMPLTMEEAETLTAIIEAEESRESMPV